ncbi:magnesium-translocating P-type ATPase [Atopobiaceae bacterium HCP3S3_A4]
MFTIKNLKHLSSKRASKAEAYPVSWVRQIAASGTEELFEEFNTRPGGLEPDEVELARASYGANELSHKQRDPEWLRFLKAFADPFTGVLALLALVTLAGDVLFAAPEDRNPLSLLIICGMILVSGILRFVQEGKSSVAADALASSIETFCSVERAGEGVIALPLSEIVAGDIVHLQAGDIVPADACLISARDLFVGMSSLTGESLPVERVAGPAAADETVPVADLSDIVFMGSSVVSGSGKAVVFATGSHTLIGSMARGLDEGRTKTAYDEGIADTSRLLLRFMLVMAPLVFAICGLTKGDWLQALLFALSVAVGLTPEMLPMIVTTCLAKGARDLAEHEVIVKRLDAVQNLGAVDVLCTDKTGTLTEDHVILERHLDLDGKEDARVLGYAYLNSFFGTGVKNLMDSAIIERAALETKRTGTLDADRLADAWQHADELPFDFSRRRVSVIVRADDGTLLMVEKGAVEEVLATCTEAELGGVATPLTPEVRSLIERKVADLGRRGMRVLAVAVKVCTGHVGAFTAEDECDMKLVGYLAFLDPPKRSAASAIEALTVHGVATKVLTGDALGVAVTVAQTIGIPTDHVLEGAKIQTLSDEELERRAEETTIFAKLTPDQKVRVVSALRRAGHVVAFMGDGVNDAGAMRASDCGISVDTAADVSKEAADIILTKKDLAVLEEGIVSGRRTSVNMNKYVKMCASSNFGNIFSVLVASICLPFLPMTAVQLLLLNFINDCASCALPWDRVDEEALARPVKWQSGAVSGFMRLFGPVSSAFDILTFVALFFWICPAVAGGSWEALAGDAAARLLFAGTFQAAWFAESMVTQMLFVHLARTEKKPFVESRADVRLAGLSAGAALLSLLIPETAIGASLGFAALPASFIALLPALALGYAVSVLLQRRRYIARFGRLI